MGICLSAASSDPQEAKESLELVELVKVEDRLCCTRLPRLASLHSQQGNKGPNQDGAVICQNFGMEEGVFCGVFDGHGKNGHTVSKIVRNCLPSLILGQQSSLGLFSPPTNSIDDHGDQQEISDGELKPSNVLNEWRRACANAFKLMDKELKLQESLDCSFSGTTAVTIIKQGQDLVISNLGDSRAVLGTISDLGELKAVQLTNDLKPSLPKEAERIRKSSGRIFALKDEPHIQRVWLPKNDLPGLAMARAFGDFILKDYGIISIPEISYYRLNNKDQFVVLATDGVWDVLSNSQVAAIVWSAENEEAAAKAVVDAAVNTWRQKFPSSKMDDCTAICHYFQERQQQKQMPRKS